MKNKTISKFEEYIKSKNETQLKRLFPDYKYVSVKSLLNLPLYCKENILLYHGIK